MNTIYTIGHGLLPLDTVVLNLHAYRIDLVIDVRSHPISNRAPQFNRERLRDELEQRGIRYAWMGRALGGRPPSPLRTPLGAPDYERMAEEPATVEALDTVIEAAARSRIALLCSESDPDGCHRMRMLEPQLEVRGAAVAHILSSGELTATPTLFS